ncbi:N-acetyltransferase family protein [Methanococcoides sp. FTZ1]|uniref:GNAT family N-acetyltransferase n=1 Tax=Methanococcoides sp. FTZ1 TaxID=3439061 RepID=UPI003F826DBC
MIVLRPFEANDNAALLEIDRLCPQGNDRIAEAMEKSPDIVARYKLYDNWKVVIAEEDGQIAGWIGWTLKKDVSGIRYGYLAEVMIHPEFRRRGIAGKLIKEVERDLVENNASYVYCYIFEPNEASNILFGKHGYEKMDKMLVEVVSVYRNVKVSQDHSVRLATKDDIQEIVELINNYNSGRSNFVPYTTVSFEEHVKNMPGYGMEYLWVASSGSSIVACVGLWDISLLAKFYYAKEPASMRVLGLIFNLLDRFTSMPKIPAENELTAIYDMTDHAFAPENADAMLDLLNYLNNTLLENQRSFFAFLVTDDDPVSEVVKRLKPSIEVWNLYTKSLDGESLDLHPLYLDVRDFIM